MGLARGDHVVTGLVLLEHAPHGLDVVAGVAPVARGVEVPERQDVLQAELDAGDGVGDLAADELEPPLGPGVVEQDPARGVEPVRLPVVERRVVPEDLGRPVRRSRVEGRGLVLGCLADLAEHLRRRRLVEADGISVGPADDPDRLQQPEHPGATDVRGELGLAKRQRHETDGAEVVDLVRLDLLDHGDERREILEVSLDDLQLGGLVLDHLDLGVVLAADHAVDVVTLPDEQAGQMPAVLAGDPGDQGAGHGRAC